MARVPLPRIALLTVCALLLLPGCSEQETNPEVEVRVSEVMVDERSQSPVVVLEELEGSRRLPIWIGFAEAQSIAAELEKVRAPRPNTHDLAKRLIDQLEGAVERVVVTRISEGVYYALLVIRSGERVLEIDARPSDAIAIALRYEAPLFVRELVFGGAGDDGLELEGGQRI
jgi:bifunctional DNase/RNase